jgi:uroporphyrinogen decarboxylase
VLAAGTAADVVGAVTRVLEDLGDRSRFLMSCGGGMPPGVPTGNIEAMIATTRALTR